MPRPDWNKHYVAGKGSWRRPEDAAAYRENFDRIFQKSCAKCSRSNYAWQPDWCQVLGVAAGTDEMPCGGTEYLEG